MPHLAARQRFILTLTLVAAACIGAAGIFVVASQNARAGRAALQAIETQIQTLEQEHASDMQTSKVLGRRGRDIERLRKFFVDAERPLDFIERIEDLARRTGNGAALTLEQSGAEPKTLFLRLTLEGGGSSIASMLSLIDALPYDIKIERMSYETLGERGGQIPTLEGAKAAARMIITLGVKTR